MTAGSRSLKLPAEAGKQMHFTDAAMEAIESLIPSRFPLFPPKFTGECRLLLHELFTNAVNHSSSKEVGFTFTVTRDGILIEMITEGPGFKIKPVNSDSTPGVKIFEPPYEGLTGETFILHLDADFEVVCRVDGPFELSLFNRERKSTGADQKNMIPEHFGLFIITRLGSGVCYRKDSSGTNILSLTLPFPKS